MSTMDLHVWRTREAWPKRLYLGRIGWDLDAWKLASGPAPTSDDRAEYLLEILGALRGLEPPAARTEEAVCRALSMTTARAVFRTAKNLTLPYGPVLDIRLRYTCPCCHRPGRLRRNDGSTRFGIFAKHAWSVQRPHRHPDVHASRWECRHCAMSWQVSGTAPFEHLPMEPEKKTWLWKAREARVICEIVQHVLFDVETQPSDRDRIRTLLLLPHFQAVLLRGGLKEFVRCDPTLESFLKPETVALCDLFTSLQAEGEIDIEWVARDEQELEEILDLCAFDEDA